jgi:hypothetical protein
MKMFEYLILKDNPYNTTDIQILDRVYNGTFILDRVYNGTFTVSLTYTPSRQGSKISG